MRTEIVSLLVGMVVGGIFAALKLPIPAPNALSGVLGISGIYFGSKLVEWIIQNSDKILSFFS